MINKLANKKIFKKQFKNLIRVLTAMKVFNNYRVIKYQIKKWIIWIKLGNIKIK